MKPITIWTMVTESGNKKHNHIEDGHTYSDYPLPKNELFNNQKAWKTENWIKTFGYLTDDYKVIISKE